MGVVQRQVCDFDGTSRSLLRIDDEALREGGWMVVPQYGKVWHACPECARKMIDWASGAEVKRPRRED